MNEFLFYALFFAAFLTTKHYIFDIPRENKQRVEDFVEKANLRSENMKLWVRIHELEQENMRLKTKSEENIVEDEKKPTRG